MVYAAIFVALILIFCVGRIVFLNREIIALEVGISHLGGSRTAEQETEYQWAINARDSKKEGRTIWLGGAGISVIALASALFELTRK